MRVDVFGKKRTTTEGKNFISYFGKLKRNGEEITVQIKFPQATPSPSKVPCTIEFDKHDANYTEKEKPYIDKETQEEKKTIERVMWVSEYTETEYIDTSMDGFDE